jgi:WD40 repeat protein
MLYHHCMSICVSLVEHSPDGKHIGSGSHNRIVKIWDAATGKKASSVS